MFNEATWNILTAEGWKPLASGIAVYGVAILLTFVVISLLKGEH